MCITGDQFGELGQHHVLRTGRPLLLGLDLLRSFNCGECLRALCPLIPDICDTDTDAWENMVMSVKAAQKTACNIHDKLDQAIRTLHIKGIIQQLKQKSIHKKSFQQQMKFFKKYLFHFSFHGVQEGVLRLLEKHEIWRYILIDLTVAVVIHNSASFATWKRIKFIQQFLI